jgi:hypothetical protein
MKILFIESLKFTEQITKLDAEGSLQELENELLADPECGDLIQGTGGFRKIRMKMPGRGKSAGARVVYFYVRERAAIMLFFLYTKSSQGNLTAEQKAALRMQAAYLK